MKMKAYIVTEGYYSDYHIVGTALDYDIAEAILKYKCRDHGRIEEYDICEDRTLVTNTKDYVKYWRIIFETDGTFKDAKLKWWVPEPYLPYVKFYANQHEVCVCDNDLERAKKIAIDARNMELAKVYGINIS